MSNFFDIFNLELRYTIPLEQLEQQYRALQQQYHPDQTAHSATITHEQAVHMSSLINTAYETLKSPSARANHILECLHQHGGFDQSIADISFLSSALELREQLEEAKTSSEIDALYQEAAQWLDSLGREFNIDLTDEDFAEARDTTRKIRFIENLMHDLNEAAHRLDTEHIDDELLDLF